MDAAVLAADTQTVWLRWRGWSRFWVMPADRPNPSARYEALFKGAYIAAVETETVASLPDVDRKIAAPTTTVFGSASQGQACRRRVDTGTGRAC